MARADNSRAAPDRPKEPCEPGRRAHTERRRDRVNGAVDHARITVVVAPS